MSEKIKLKTIHGPKADFTIPVVVQNLQGADVEIIFTCRARTRTEWAPIHKEIWAERMAEVKKQAEEGLANEGAEKANAEHWKTALANVQKFEETDVVEMAGLSNRRQAEFAAKIATAWDLDDPMTIDNLAGMEDQFPGGVAQLVEKYTRAIQGAREKN